MEILAIVVVLIVGYFIFFAEQENSNSSGQNISNNYKSNIGDSTKSPDEKRKEFYKSFNIPDEQHETLDILLGVKKPIDSSLERKVRKSHPPKSNLLKPEWIEIKKILSKQNIKTLYHFTDKSNIDSIIKSGGLYSWYYLDNNGIHIPAPGGNQLSRNLDKRYELENYVRLSFKKNIPMKYVTQNDGRIKDPVILEIDIDVNFLKTTLFSNKNATSKDSNIGGTLNDFKKIRFDILKNKEWRNEEEKSFWQAEVLVKEHVPLENIRNLNNGDKTNIRTKTQW